MRWAAGSETIRPFFAVCSNWLSCQFDLYTERGWEPRTPNGMEPIKDLFTCGKCSSVFVDAKPTTLRKSPYEVPARNPRERRFLADTRQIQDASIADPNCLPPRSRFRQGCASATSRICGATNRYVAPQSGPVHSSPSSGAAVGSSVPPSKVIVSRSCSSTKPLDVSTFDNGIRLGASGADIRAIIGNAH